MQLVYSGTTSIQVILECPYRIQPHCIGLATCKCHSNIILIFVVTVNDGSLMDCPTTQPTTDPGKLLVSFPDHLCRQHVILCVTAFRYNMHEIVLKIYLPARNTHRQVVCHGFDQPDVLTTFLALPFNAFFVT